jgi:hypothetical protein
MGIKPGLVQHIAQFKLKKTMVGHGCGEVKLNRDHNNHQISRTKGQELKHFKALLGIVLCTSCFGIAAESALR